MLEMLNKFRRSAVFFRSTCDMYTSGHEIAMRRFEIDVNIISSYRTDMQVLPCGAIGVLLSLQYKALNKHRGRSHIVYSRPAIITSFPDRPPQSIRPSRSLSARTCEDLSVTRD
jgi:hypothetical protein